MFVPFPLCSERWRNGICPRLQTQNKLILFSSTRISRGSNPQNTHFLFHSETSKMTTNPLSPETKSNKLKSAQSKWPKYTHKDPVWDVSIGPLILGHAANELSGDQKERQPFSVSGGSTLNTAVCHCSSKMQKKMDFRVRLEKEQQNLAATFSASN